MPAGRAPLDTQSSGFIPEPFQCRSRLPESFLDTRLGVGRSGPGLKQLHGHFIRIDRGCFIARLCEMRREERMALGTPERAFEAEIARR